MKILICLETIFHMFPRMPKLRIPKRCMIHILRKGIENYKIFNTDLAELDGSSGNASDLYSRDTRFESRL
jgi:hypothetical protein